MQATYSLDQQLEMFLNKFNLPEKLFPFVINNDLSASPTHIAQFRKENDSFEYIIPIGGVFEWGDQLHLFAHYLIDRESGKFSNATIAPYKTENIIDYRIVGIPGQSVPQKLLSASRIPSSAKMQTVKN